MPVRNAVRVHPSQWAFRLHRISGVALVCFLPVHFVLLANQLGAEVGGELASPWYSSSVTRWTHCILAGLLGTHMVGGLRVLAIQFLQMSRAQGLWLAITLASGFVVALMIALGMRH